MLSVVVLLATSVWARALAPDNYASESVLDSGNWLKIKVDTTGVHELTYEELRAVGFSDPSSVAVYGYGGLKLINHVINNDLPDDLSAVPVLHVDGKLLFYAVGAAQLTLVNGVASRERNVYSDSGYYFLTDSQPIKTVESTPRTLTASGGNVYDSHVSAYFVENDVECPTSGGTEYFSTNLAGAKTGAATMQLSTIGCLPSTAVNVRYLYGMKNMLSSSIEIGFPSTVTVTTRSFGRCSGISAESTSNYTRATGSFSFLKNSDDDDLKFELKIPSGATFAAIDYVTVKYERRNAMGGVPSLEMYMPSAAAGDQVSVHDWNAHCHLWVVRPDGNIAECPVTTDGADGQAVFPDGDVVKMCAFDAGKTQNKVKVVGPVVAQNLHGSDVPELLIITTDALWGQATALADLHRHYQGMDVAVVKQEQIFNEFGSGTPHPCAYRRFIQMLHEKNAQKFRYVLLYGSGRYDNRTALRVDSTALLTYQCELTTYNNQPTSAYCADMYFGMLSPKFEPQTVYREYCDVAVGRIPATDVRQAMAVNNKIERYLSNPPRVPLINNVLVVCDDKDKNSHLNQAEEAVGVMEKATDGNVTCRKVYHALYPIDSKNDATVGREMIKNTLKRGVAYMCYTGHSDGTYFTGHHLWGVGSIAETEVKYPPLTMWSTCESFNFDRMRSDMGQISIFVSNGGSIGTIGSCRVAYQDYNGMLMRSVSDSLYSAEAGVMLGEVFRRARNGVISMSIAEDDRRMGVNTLCYNYGGDPALPLYNAASGIDVNVKDEVLHLLSDNEMTGSIMSADGNVDDSFNGTAIITVYDTPYVRNTYPRGVDAVVSVSLDEEVLAEKSVAVTNGRFSANMFLPQSVRGGSEMRVSVYAFDSDNVRRATGGLSKLPTELSTDGSFPTDSVPKIVSMYVGNPDFVSGDVVSPRSTFHAEIKGSATGINMSQQAVGMSPSLRLDGCRSLRLFHDYADDGTLLLTADLADLPEGEHTLELIMADNAGNHTNRRVAFVVRQTCNATMSVEECPASETATMMLHHDMQSVPEARLMVEDWYGNTVFARDNVSFPYAWDLKDNDGRPVPDGNYAVYSVLRNGTITGSTPRVEIVVVKATHE